MWEIFAEVEKDSKYVKCKHKESIQPTVARGGDEPRSFSTMIQKNHPKNHHPSWFLKFYQKHWDILARVLPVMTSVYHRAHLNHLI